MHVIRIDSTCRLLSRKSHKLVENATLLQNFSGKLIQVIEDDIKDGMFSYEEQPGAAIPLIKVQRP